MIDLCVKDVCVQPSLDTDFAVIFRGQLPFDEAEVDIIHADEPVRPECHHLAAWALPLCLPV